MPCRVEACGCDTRVDYPFTCTYADNSGGDALESTIDGIEGAHIFLVALQAAAVDDRKKDPILD